MSEAVTPDPGPEDSLSRPSEALRSGADLSPALAEQAAAALASAVPSVEEKEEFLRLLAGKGETPVEVAAFARVFRGRARGTGLDDLAAQAIDVVGTGGDRSGTFNFSTATALLLASIGVPVMKHGNRSVSSKSGSADLLAALGVPMDAGNDFLRESLERHRFCFFFAPAFHPAFKEIMPVRKKLAEAGVRTIFNLLGPLINPGRPVHQLMGVFSAAWVEPVAAALEDLGLDAALTVHCATGPTQGVDELTAAGDNLILGSGRLAGIDFPSAPEAYGLRRCAPEDIRGGDAARNLDILRDLAAGQASEAMSDTLAFNAGAALLIVGRSASIAEGVETARAALSEGRLARWLGDFESFNHSHS